MARHYFGTDGVRGKVGEAPITPDFVMKLGMAAGRVLRRRSPSGHAAVLIGKDTRVSGYMLGRHRALRPHSDPRGCVPHARSAS